VTAAPATRSMSVEPGSAVRCVWVTHAERLSRRMPRRAGCPIQRSSLHYRRARRLRWLTSPPMTWALRRTPSGRPAHASQPTTLRKLGPRNGNGSGCTSLPLSVNSFSTINNAGAPSAGTSSTTDLRPATHPLLPRPALLGCGPGSLELRPHPTSTPRCRQHIEDYATDLPSGTCRFMPSSTTLSLKDLRSPMAVIVGGVPRMWCRFRRTARRATGGRWR
jgi:hypothetical protein